MIEIAVIILVAVAVITMVTLYVIYVHLIQKRNKVKEAVGGIDVQLKKRYDLIPNILTVANKFMEHERDLITNITNLRTQVSELRTDAENISEKLKLDNQISNMMGKLLVNVENYPQLKSDNTMIQAMQTYSEVEEHIAAARRFYNSAVNDLNNAVEIFPSSVVAAACNIKSYPFFETSDSERQPINASEYFYKN